MRDVIAVEVETPLPMAGRALMSADAVVGEMLPGIPDWLLEDDVGTDSDSGD